jgi:hypothetical protein
MVVLPQPAPFFPSFVRFSLLLSTKQPHTLSYLTKEFKNFCAGLSFAWQCAVDYTVSLLSSAFASHYTRRLFLAHRSGDKRFLFPRWRCVCLYHTTPVVPFSLIVPATNVFCSLAGVACVCITLHQSSLSRSSFRRLTFFVPSLALLWCCACVCGCVSRVQEQRSFHTGVVMAAEFDRYQVRFDSAQLGMCVAVGSGKFRDLFLRYGF